MLSFHAVLIVLSHFLFNQGPRTTCTITVMFCCYPSDKDSVLHAIHVHVTRIPTACMFTTCNESDSLQTSWVLTSLLVCSASPNISADRDQEKPHLLI